MIWFIEIPIIVFIIAGMMIGSLQLGEVLRIIGWITLLLTAVAIIVPIVNKESLYKTEWYSAAWLLGLNAAVCLVIGILMGDMNLFEFLFGSGWT